MKTRRIIAFAISGLLTASPAFAAHGGGAAHATAHASSHISAPRPASANLASTAHTRSRDRGNSRERSERRNRFANNAVAVYPWWLYNNDYSNPYNNDYTTASTPNSASSDNGGCYSNGTPASGPDYNTVRSDMAAIQARQQAALFASPQWVAASDDLNKAQADLQAATDQLKATLLARPDYRAAVEQKRAAQDRATALHQQPEANDAEIFAAAQDDLNASAAISRIERDATTIDPAVTDARVRLQAAATARKAMTDGLHAQVMSDPQWQAGKQELADVR